MKINLVTGNTKNFKMELPIVAFSNHKIFYKTCIAIAKQEVEVLICNRRVYVDITKMEYVAELEDFVKCLNFFKNEVNEVFVECTEIQLQLLKRIKPNRIIRCKDNCYTVYH